MKAEVWYIAKPGEERTYATTKPPSPHWAESLRKQGYQIMVVQFHLPREFDETSHGRVQRGNVLRVVG